MIAVAEGMNLGVKLGMDPKKLADIVNTSSGYVRLSRFFVFFVFAQLFPSPAAAVAGRYSVAGKTCTYTKKFCLRFELPISILMFYPQARHGLESQKTISSRYVRLSICLVEQLFALPRPL